MDRTLQELGLTPSDSLVVQKKEIKQATAGTAGISTWKHREYFSDTLVFLYPWTKSVLTQWCPWINELKCFKMYISMFSNLHLHHCFVKIHFLKKIPENGWKAYLMCQWLKSLFDVQMTEKLYHRLLEYI